MAHQNASYRMDSPLLSLAALAWAGVSTFALLFVVLTYFKGNLNATLLAGVIFANGCGGLLGMLTGGGFFAGFVDGYRTGRSIRPMRRSDGIAAPDGRQWELEDGDGSTCFPDHHEETPLINPATGLEMSGGVDSAGYLVGEN